MKMKKMTDHLQKILNLIKDNHRFLITSHRDPDGDSIGSQLALAYLVENLQKTCRIINQGELPKKYAFLDPQGKIESFEQSENSSDINLDADIVFVLDCTSKNRIGELAEAIPQRALIVNVDHHADNEQFGALNYVDPDASAVGEMIFSLIKSSGISLNPKVATQLYAAILTDTGRFKFGNTSPSCLGTCAALLKEGADPRCITNQIYFNHSLAFLKLLGSILGNLEISEDNRICAMTLRWKTLVDLGVDPKELEGLVNYSLFLKGVEIGLLFTEKEDGKTKVNLRSQNEFDVASVARYFGGGGHRNAAGCTVSYHLDETKKIVTEKIQKILRHEPVGSLDS
jgi:phosphoesterase RecJ-like protein